MDEKVAAAAVTDSEIFVNRLADHSSIFTAEARTIDLALEHIKKTKTIEFSQIQGHVCKHFRKPPTNPRIVKVLEKYNRLKSREKNIFFLAGFQAM